MRVEVDRHDVTSVAQARKGKLPGGLRGFVGEGRRGQKDARRQGAKRSHRFYLFGSGTDTSWRSDMTSS